MNIRYALCILASFVLPVFVFGMEIPSRPKAISKRRLSFEQQEAAHEDQENTVPAKRMRLEREVFEIQDSVLPVSAETDQSQPVVVKFLTSENDLPYRMKEIYENPDLTTYAAQGFVYSQQGVIAAMNKAAQERNAKIHLSVGPHFQNKPSEYKVDSVVFEKDQHGKNIVGLSCSPSKGKHTKAAFLTGSANPSNAIWPRGNKETMIYVEGDTELAEQAYTLMKSQSPIKKKSTIESTPKKRSVYSSQKTKLNKSRAQRIVTIAHEEGPDRIVWASSMNINDKNMQHALSEAAKNDVDTRLIVNRSALTKNGIPILQSLVDDGVAVSVFFPLEGSRRIYHNKELIRECPSCPDKNLYVISNANFTDEGDVQKNLETYFPNDLELIKKAKAHFEKNEQSCVSFENALERLKEQKEKKSTKKKKEGK